MLEVKNLRKVYKTKNGAAVNALDGVTLQFPETGMVFLLGKSGSGKSTLLNVCGGLDSPTEGEIIVKGRSSKNFSQSDFDSYRNTFIGFIFQEYNILNEFSVEDNIALALELQGKPKDKAAINALLKEVDLEGFAKRKPNTLSGGQKQRIAIARALVKAPEIIMADEPTGALDSNTGKQVFETLKKLSSNKLVLVVSHDRDFAEQYGDRIIELKDGKVLSDVTKTQLEQQPLTDNINTVGDVLCIKRGTELTDKDFDKIKAFLKSSDEDVIIANNQTDVKNFKKASRINDKGEKEVFAQTDDSKLERKQYTKEESRFIRSKLPLRHASKIGVSSLKNKPFRLFWTIILCTVAFTLFGLLSTLNFYDSHASFVQTMQDTNPSVMQLQKDYKTHTVWYTNGEKQHEYDSYMDARFTPDDLKNLSNSFDTVAFGSFGCSTNFSLRQNNSTYWNNGISGFAVLPEDSTLRQSIEGNYPKSTNEIAISSYAANMLYTCQMYDRDGNVVELASPSQVIGKEITLNGNTYTITGIINSGEIPSKYEALKEATEPNYSLQSDYYSYLSDGIHLLVFVTQERVEKLVAENPPYNEGIHNYSHIISALKINGEYTFNEWSNSNYTNISSLAENKTVIHFNGSDSALSDNEALVSVNLFANLVSEAYRAKYENNDKEMEYTDSYHKTMELINQLNQGGIYSPDGKDNFVAFTEAEIKSKLLELVAAVKKDKINLELGIKIFDPYNSTAVGETKEFTIVGAYTGGERYTSTIYFSDNAFTTLWDEHKAFISDYSEVTSDYKQPADALYSKVYLPFVYSEQAVDNYWDVYSNTKWNEDATRLRLTGNFINNLQFIDSMVKSLSQVFLYVGLVMAVFAILLFSNFISTSISLKKKEIGILRAVGARSADVFKIFFSESFVIAAICIALSTVASVFICNLINTELAADLGASLFVFGITSFAVLVAIAILTVIIATFLPVYNAARKKPVDSIRSI